MHFILYVFLHTHISKASILYLSILPIVVLCIPYLLHFPFLHTFFSFSIILCSTLLLLLRTTISPANLKQCKFQPPILIPSYSPKYLFFLLLTYYVDHLQDSSAFRMPLFSPSFFLYELGIVLNFYNFFITSHFKAVNGIVNTNILSILTSDVNSTMTVVFWIFWKLLPCIDDCMNYSISQALRTSPLRHQHHENL